jgi:multiple antibiotic resistance protein
MRLAALFEQSFVPFFLGGLVSLITITNPVPKIPLFMTLAGDMGEAQRNEQARRACVYAFVILGVSLFAGVLILEGFGISQGALRIAGGLTVAILGYRMLFQSYESHLGRNPGQTDFAFFPLALPGISGPGSIAVVIGISTEIAELKTLAEKTLAYSATVVSLLLTCMIMWATLRSARIVSRFLGEQGMEALSRLMGFLLVCVGIQFIGSGVRTFVAGT